MAIANGTKVADRVPTGLSGGRPVARYKLSSSATGDASGGTVTIPFTLLASASEKSPSEWLWLVKTRMYGATTGAQAPSTVIAAQEFEELNPVASPYVFASNVLALNGGAGPRLWEPDYGLVYLGRIINGKAGTITNIWPTNVDTAIYAVDYEIWAYNFPCPVMFHPPLR